MISPTLSQLHTWIYGLVVAGSGVDEDNVIPADDNHSAPEGLYATIKALTNQAEGLQYVTARPATETTLAVTNSGNRRAMYSVQFLRDGAKNAAQEFRAWLYSVLGQEGLSAHSLVLREVSEIRDLTALRGTEMEERAGIDVSIGYVEALTQTINKIDTVPVSVVYSNIQEDIIDD